MKHLLLSTSFLITSLPAAQAVVIDIAGQVQGGGEFADYSSLANEAPITPDSSVSESGFTLTTVFAQQSGNANVNWNSAWSGGLTYTAGQEINFRAGDGGNGGSSTRVIGNNFFEIQLDGDSDFDWSSVSVQLWRNGSGASQYYQFAYDDDGNGTYEPEDFLGAETTVSGSGVTGSTPNELATISYSGADLPSGVSSVDGATVRLYFWGATVSGGNSHMINVAADYTAIPEPGAYALMTGLLGLGLVALRRRRQA